MISFIQLHKYFTYKYYKYFTFLLQRLIRPPDFELKVDDAVTVTAPASLLTYAPVI